MKKFLLTLILFFSVVEAVAVGLEDWYGYLSEVAGVDPNAGRSALLTLVVPPGGLYSGMAGAFTAVAKDSGFLEANPAGSALLKDTELSVYHNDWIGDSRLEGAVFTWRWGNFGAGIGGKFLYIPFTALNSWGDRYQNSWSNETAKGYYTETIATGNLSYNFLSNFYFNGITVGGNFKLAFRGVPDSIAQNQSAIAMMVDLGALTKFNFLKFYPSRQKNLSIGVVLKNIGPPVMDDPLPSSLVFGLAYSPIRPLTLSFDATIPLLLSSDFSLGNFGAFSIGGSKAESPSYAAGMDLVLTNFFSLQGGINLKQGRPRLTAGTAITVEKLMVVVNYSLDLMTTLTPFDRISVEFKVNLGDLGRTEAEDRARELYLAGLELYSKGDYKNAIDFWQKALIIRPDYTPVQEIMETAKRSLELQKRLDEIQKVE